MRAAVDDPGRSLALPDGQRLRRDAGGRLVFTDRQGVAHIGASVLRAFPLTAPDDALAIVDAEGRELAWIADWRSLAPELQAGLEASLSEREFMPVIVRLCEVSRFATPSGWRVDTDRGPRRFVLNAEEDIRRLADGGLLVCDSHGLHYRITDLQALDRASRRLLDRFL